MVDLVHPKLKFSPAWSFTEGKRRAAMYPNVKKTREDKQNHTSPYFSSKCVEEAAVPFVSDANSMLLVKIASRRVHGSSLGGYSGQFG